MLSIMIVKLGVLLLICSLSNADLDIQKIDESTPTSWRCGVFIPGKKYRAPLAKFFVMQTIHAASCPASFRDLKIGGKFSKFCSNLGKQWEKRFKGKPFIAEDADACSTVETELGLRNVPVVNEKTFPKGVQLGFYFNYCGEDSWKDTGVRTTNRVCCKDGKSDSCDDIMAENKAKLTSTTTTNTTLANTLSTDNELLDNNDIDSNSVNTSNDIITVDYEDNYGGVNVEFPFYDTSQNILFTLTRPGISSTPGLDTLDRGDIESILSILLEDGELNDQELEVMKSILSKLRADAANISEKIEVLEDVLGEGSRLDNPEEKRNAYNLLNVANCASIKINIDF